MGESARIYALVNPAAPDAIRYVGQTRLSLALRLSHHMASAKGRGTESPVAEWIRSLTAAGLRPEIREVEVCDAAAATDRERYWIQHYSSIADGDILNADNTLRKRGGGKEGIVFSPAVKERMRECGLTQVQLAQRAGVDQSLISRYLNGRNGCDPGTADRIAAVLGAPLTDLMLGGEEACGDTDLSGLMRDIARLSESERAAIALIVRSMLDGTSHA